MGFFDLFRSKKVATPEPISPRSQVSPPAPTSVPVSAAVPEAYVQLAKGKLDLRKGVLKISLEKKSMQDVKARVAVVLDKSVSMRPLYRNSTVQTTLERLLPIGIKFSPTNTTDVWLFSELYKKLKPISESDFPGYVNRVAMHAMEYSGTQYAPVIRAIVKEYVMEYPSTIPTLVIFITDGETSYQGDVRKAIIDASNYNIFFQFVGIGDEAFTFLEELDTMKGRFIDNANFFKLKDPNAVSDANLYDLLLAEYPTWEKLAKQHGLM